MFRTDKLNIKTASSFYVCPKAYVICRVVKFAPSKTYIKPRSFLVPRLKYDYIYLVIVISPVSPFHATLYPSCSDTNLTGIKVRESFITGTVLKV